MIASSLHRPAITEFMRMPNGGRGRSFTIDGIRVDIPAHEDDARAATLAARLSTALEELDLAEKRIAALRARVPPVAPVRLLGVGCVRFDHKGRLWLLNRTAGGWSEFGIWLDGWDDLFRRYAVRVVRHGIDKDGAWWEVENEPRAVCPTSTEAGPQTLPQKPSEKKP